MLKREVEERHRNKSAIKIQRAYRAYWRKKHPEPKKSKKKRGKSPKKKRGKSPKKK